MSSATSITLTFLLTTNLLRATALIQEDFEFLIFHTNDMHSRFEEIKHSIDGKLVGGMARVAHVIRKARREAEKGKGPPVLYLDAGDVFTGTTWFIVHKEKIAVDFMNALKPDAMSLGNHEFDLGLPALLSFLQNTTFPVVTANIRYNDEKDFEKLMKESVVLTIKGRKIGIVGYLITATKLYADFRTAQMLDEVEAVKRVSKQLTQAGVKIIIALGHAGYKLDKKIAMEVEDVDVVVGGHTNTFLWNGPIPDMERPEGPYPKVITQRSGKKVPVVQAYTKSKYVGKLSLTFDNSGNLKSFQGNPILMDTNIPQEKDLLELLEKYRPEITALNTTSIGQSKVYLDGRKCRQQECNLGNLIADSFVRYHAVRYNKSNYWTDASIAMINSGSIRGNVNATARENNVYKSDILGCFPYQSFLFIITMSGKDLLRTLEIGARSMGETSRGEFMLIAGLKIAFDFTKSPGFRVRSVKVLCTNCEVPTYSQFYADGYYRVITTDFLMKGGDGHVAIKDNAKNAIALNVSDIDAIFEYFQELKVVMPIIDGRMVLESTLGITTNLKSTPSVVVLVLLLILVI